MSSRALRRAQRELEEKKDQSEKLDEEETISASSLAPKRSLFAMLRDADDGVDDNSDDSDDDVEPKADPSEAIEEAEKESIPVPKSAKKSRKKKKKGKGKAEQPEMGKAGTKSKSMSGLDEIDQAILALNLSSQTKRGNDTSDQQTPQISEEIEQLQSALSVDSQHLHAANEMRKLFGRAAVQDGDEDEPGARRAQGGLAAAVAGRNAPRRNLASLALRRNIFIQGKEEWPRATSGGLGMEIVEKRSDGSIEYRFVHDPTYQSVQRQFETCVASMDPERLYQLLYSNPYHISTLLQVSEIAKQQRDNATAGELLERALFSFGRVVHSTFSSNLAQGKARLDFRSAENREFWLAVWRYIATLGIRATWHTAFEWGKLLLSMSPEDDPYCIRLIIDQLALRGREAQDLVNIIESDYLQRAWKIPPNLAYSVALAYDRLKQPEKARNALRLAIKEYPWIAARLCKELEISPIPKQVWGKEPNGDHQELLCQLYVPHAKDLWNTTGGTSLLVEVSCSFEEPLGAGENPYWLADINKVDLARHVILSDDRSLLSLLDPDVKSKYTSTSDPLPPDDSFSPHSVTTDSRALHRTPDDETPDGRTPQELFAYLQQLGDGFRIDQLEDFIDIPEGMTEEELHEFFEERGTTLEEYRGLQVRALMAQFGIDPMGETELENDAQDA